MRSGRHLPSARLACAAVALLCASLVLAACGKNDKSSSASRTQTANTTGVKPTFRSARQRRAFEIAHQDQFALAQMSVVFRAVDACGKQARAHGAGVGACETPQGLARVPGSGVTALGPNTASVRATTDPNARVRVAFGTRRGQVEVRAGREGFALVSRSTTGNVFTESKRRYGSRNRNDLSLTCTKRGRGFCPPSGDFKKPNAGR